MELLDQLKLEKLEIEKEIIYLESELASPDTPESMVDDIQLKLDEANQELLLVLSEIQDEEDRLKREADEAKRPLLLARLAEVSKNNTAFIEAYGHMPRWKLKHKEICECHCVDELEAHVIKLENALKAVNYREAVEKAAKEAKKAETESKLATLGLTKEDLLALLK